MNPQGNNNSNNSQSARSQIIDKVRAATNILITVSDSPSVDQLCSLIGLSLTLHKLDKHSTAVYSGDTPPAIGFLEPGKTLEKNVDSLRDLIISLDKNKADKLHYKQEGDFVKIYITPYRTKIDQNDLTFEQGDFNVELVIALGVSDRGSIDQAIATHGKILHDATVVTISCGQQTGDFGSINWSSKSASSLAEMLVGLIQDMDKDLLDQDSATAFLTGIVAETDRFSNTKTTPQVMTLSAQLMGMGANQQLISTQLSSSNSSVGFSPDEPEPDSITLRHEADDDAEAPASADPTELNLDHVEPEGPEPVAESPSEPATESPSEPATESPSEPMPDPRYLEPVDEQPDAEPSQESAPEVEPEPEQAPQPSETPAPETAAAEAPAPDVLLGGEPESQPTSFTPIAVDPAELEQLLKPAASTSVAEEAAPEPVQEPVRTADIQMPTPQIAPTPFEFVPIKPQLEEQKIVGKVIQPGGQSSAEPPTIKPDHSRSFLGADFKAPSPVEFSEPSSGAAPSSIGFLGHGSGARAETPPPPTGMAVPSPWSPPVVDLSSKIPENAPESPPNTFRFPTPAAPTPVAAPAQQPMPQTPQISPTGDLTLPPPIAPPPTPL